MRDDLGFESGRLSGRGWLLYLSALAIGLACVGGVAVTWRTQGFWRPGPLVDSERFGDYEVRIYCRHEENLFEKVCDRLPSTVADVQYHIPGVSEWERV